MKIVMTRQADRKIHIEDPKENVVVDITEPHMELFLEDNSILVLPSTDVYYKIISDAEVFMGSLEVHLDKLITKNAKINLVNYKLNDHFTIKTVCIDKYNGEDFQLIKGELS